MKTPREILLDRHHKTEVRLDQIRDEVVAGLGEQEDSRRGSPLLIAAILKLWRELVLPARYAWSGIAAIWIVILTVTFATRESSPVREADRAIYISPEIRRLLKAQEQLVAELLDRTEKHEAERPKAMPPRPWSKRDGEYLNA